MFQASMTINVGNGKASLFWRDRWINNLNVEAIAPLLLTYVDDKIINSCTIEEGLSQNKWIRDLNSGLSVPAIMQYLSLWSIMSTFHLQPEVEDVFQWIWTANKCFTAKSAYLAFFEGRTIWPWHESIWECKAPLKYKIFAWKVAWNRCWTNDRRKRHGLTNDDSCALCLQEKETAEHLLLQCPFSRVIWFEVLRGMGHASVAPLATSELLSWWTAAVASWPCSLRPKVRSLFLLVLRSIWMERNNIIFKNYARTEALLLDAILAEAERWKIVGFCE